MDKAIERLAIIQQIEAFLKEYGEYYTPLELSYIRKNYYETLKGKFHADLLRQIYTELGIITEEENIYNGFINILENNFDINRDIIEIGGGTIPSLAKIIANKKKTGTITVYDPRVISQKGNPENLILKKEKFTLATNTKKEELLIAFMPCQAAQQIILNVGRNGNDFIIGLCEGGPHGDEFDYFEGPEEWLLSMISTAKSVVKKKDLGTLEFANLKEYGDPYPVIYNKKRP